MSEPLRRPAWLPAEDWRQLLALHGGAPRCSVCGTIDNLSVDHIVPRHYGGTSDLPNLDFKCIHHNSLKGIADDRYWSRPFLWDEVPDVAGFRAAQRDIYMRLTQDAEVSAWFAQAATQVSKHLYLLAWVVGAGKTLAIPAVALAYNQAQIRRWGRASRRADHILVLTKEQNIRDELARALRDDITGYGILSAAPRVKILESYDDLFSSERWLEGYDIVVACVQMFWGKNDEPKKDIIEALGKFCLIFIDEPHFAHGQVQRLLKSAPRSVVFGLTGTPIRRNTSVLQDYVLLSAYTYQDADRYDRSLKHIDPARSLHPVPMDSADVLRAGHERTVSSGDDPDYDGSSLITAQQVASYVMRLMQELDVELPGRPAPHRDASVNADLLYPAHAMIRVPTRAMAEMLRKQIDAHFKANRRLMPAAKGWGVNSIFLGDGDLPGDYLDPDNHPWMRAWRIGNERLRRWKEKGQPIDPAAIYVCDELCARILIVVGMAREGVSNPLCAITASIGNDGSIVEAVQRWVGRAARTPKYIDSDGEVHYPPDGLDTVHFVFHETNEVTRKTAESGIRWILNMGEYLRELPTIGDLIDDKTVLAVPDPRTIDDPLTAAKKVSMAVEAVEISGENWRNDDESVDQIVGALCLEHARDNPDKAARIREWIAGTLRNEPEDAFRATGHLLLDEDLPTLSVVMAEREKHDPSTERLIEWARRMRPELTAYLPTMDQNPGLRESVKGDYLRWADQGMMAQVQPDMDLEEIRKAFTAEVMDFLKGNLSNERAASGVAKNSINIAFRIVLQVPQGETCGNGTRWDIPQVHTLLLRPDVRRAILGYARARLIRKGYCPKIARAFGLTFDE